MLQLPDNLILLHHATEVDVQYKYWLGRWHTVLDGASSAGGQAVTTQTVGATGTQGDTDLEGEEAAPSGEPCVSTTACTQAAGQHHGTVDAVHAQATGAVPSGQASAAPAPVSAADAALIAGSRPKKRKRKKQVEQAVLDARHPGNVRNRAAGMRVATAFDALQAWLAAVGQAQQAEEGAQQHAARLLIQTAQLPLGQPTSHAGAADNAGAAAREDGETDILEATARPCSTSGQNRAQAGRWASSQVHELGRMDWQSLYDTRGVERPKALVLGPATSGQQVLELLQAADASISGLEPGAVTAPLKSTTAADFHVQGSAAPVPVPVLQSNLFHFLVSNPYPCEALALAHNEPVLMPRGSGFLMADVTAKGALTPLLRTGHAGTYRVIVADPPWENASVHRSGAYRTLPSRHLLKLPVQRLLNQEQGVVLLWVTNRERVHRFIHEELLPTWGLVHVATWYWLKLLPGGSAPVSSLASAHRHPWEPILVLAPAAAAAQPAGIDRAASSVTSMQPAHGTVVNTGNGAGQQTDVQGEHSVPLPAAQPGAQPTCQEMWPWRCLPDGLVIASVPAKEHSRKPHLGRVLDTLLGEWGSGEQAGGGPGGSGGHPCAAQAAGRGLELFGRELRAGWDVVGDEVLRFQGLAGFEPCTHTH